MNRDGKLDFAVSNNGSSSISVVLGDGRFGFTAQTPRGVGIKPCKIVHLDLNRDGKPDLAVVNSTSGTLALLLGNGAGGFSSASSVNATGGFGPTPTGLDVGDFNHDGIPDLLVGDFNTGCWPLLGQ